jgi:hypothetical protein
MSRSAAHFHFKGMDAGLGIRHGDLECAVNVPYGRNRPSTSSHFCNPDNTFRASVFVGNLLV